jgi:hypothetical protein
LMSVFLPLRVTKRLVNVSVNSDAWFRKTVLMTSFCRLVLRRTFKQSAHGMNKSTRFRKHSSLRWQPLLTGASTSCKQRYSFSGHLTFSVPPHLPRRVCEAYFLCADLRR